MCDKRDVLRFSQFGCMQGWIECKFRVNYDVYMIFIVFIMLYSLCHADKSCF